MLIKNTVDVREKQNITKEIAGKLVPDQIEEKITDSNVKREEKSSEGVNLTISKEALERMKEEMEQIRESNTEAKKDISTTSKCMRIASRLVQGDSVPVQDIKYLMKHDMELYGQSMKMRIPKKDPKKWDSELSDEELKEIEQIGLSIEKSKVLSVNIILKDM